jgi:hypothetical protein
MEGISDRLQAVMRFILRVEESRHAHMRIALTNTIEQIVATTLVQGVSDSSTLRMNLMSRNAKTHG